MKLSPEHKRAILNSVAFDIDQEMHHMQNEDLSSEDPETQACRLDTLADALEAFGADPWQVDNARVLAADWRALIAEATHA